MTVDVMALCAAIDDFDPHAATREAREQGQWPSCVACGGDYCLDIEHEATALCDSCAHELTLTFARFILNQKAPSMPTKKPTKKKPTKTKKKPTKKPPWTGKPASLWAVKGPNVPKKSDYMPDEVVMCLEGSAPKLLEQLGWGIVAKDKVIDGMSDVWPRDRIEANLERLKDIWIEDFGRGWKFEIREHRL